MPNWRFPIYVSVVAGFHIYVFEPRLKELLITSEEVDYCLPAWSFYIVYLSKILYHLTKDVKEFYQSIIYLQDFQQVNF